MIGQLSDRYGRRTALLWSMVGNILSVALWVLAVDFRTFLASRVVGGLSEGNVQLATAIATDISSEQERGKTMALVGACFKSRSRSARNCTIGGLFCAFASIHVWCRGGMPLSCRACMQSSNALIGYCTLPSLFMGYG